MRWSSPQSRVGHAHKSPTIPRMARIYRPPVYIRANRVASRLFTLDQRVVVCLANGLHVLDVEEQFGVAFVRLLVVGNCCTWMVSVALYDDAAAALASIKVAEERLFPDPVWAAPARIAVELAVLLGFRAARVPALLLVSERHV